MLLETNKIIFTGPVGAGKTTAIGAISDTPPVGTDVRCSDESSLLKDTTTVAMDYSYISLEDGSRVHLYGTPGQDRFDFMWKILSKGGIGLVLLVNNDHPNPIKQLDHYLDAFSDFIIETGVVIGITRSGIADNASIEDYQQRLLERNQVFPVFEIDARSCEDVKILVHALLAILEY
jgi:signal recognition particle receptor subunit beta